ncbi:MAG: hypothetical protein ACLFQA_00210 [Bacteroidales bacterium]
MAAQIIIIVLLSLNLGIAIAEHGEPRTGKENAWHMIIGTVIWVLLLWWGGFFNFN